MTAAACDPGQVALVDVTDPGREIPDSVVITVLRPDSTAAAGARVSWFPMDTRVYSPSEGWTDAAGRLSLRLAPGSLYWIAAEMEDHESGVLGGGEKTYGPQGESTALDLLLRRPRSVGIVISEIYVNAPNPWETGGEYYEYGKYIELTNNSDEVVALDGMLIGNGYRSWRDSGEYGHHRCVDTAVIREDPNGVWSYLLWSFPGSGSEHLLEPGQTAVVAVSAADHSDIHPSMLDLSGADFEFRHPAVADNPAAPDMVLEGPETPSVNPFSGTWPYWLVAGPGDPGTFLRADDPGASQYLALRLLRVPESLLQDVVYAWYDRTNTPLSDSDPCLHPVHPRFDAIPGPFDGYGDLDVSAQRRRVTVDGRSILLDTNTSWVDFDLAERTPGTLP